MVSHICFGLAATEPLDSRNAPRPFAHALICRRVLPCWVSMLASAACFTLFAGSGDGQEVAVLALKRAVLTNYSEVIARGYQDSVKTATSLATAIDLLVEKPSEQSLGAGRQAWLTARIPYLQTEAGCFYDGPIDQLDGMINAWPVDESYIDYVAGNPDAGIINMRASYPALSEALILSLNEKEGEKNISTGYHAIEFLLWGQDFSKDGPGNRPWKDYSEAARNAGRRGQYLRITAKLLVEHLQTVANAWSNTSQTNYRAQFLAADPDESLAKILKGMGVLSGPELAGERLTVPFQR